jgi:hypothetical protein
MELGRDYEMLQSGFGLSIDPLASSSSIWDHCATYNSCTAGTYNCNTIDTLRPVSSSSSSPGSTK